jgi:hypothetical protein
MDPADAARAAFAALADLPAANARIEAQLREVLARLDALAVTSPPALIDLAEAHRLGWITSLATGRRLAKNGEIPAKRVGKRWLIDVAAMKPPTEAEIGARAARAARR